jgi:hypothetical protein
VSGFYVQGWLTLLVVIFVPFAGVVLSAMFQRAQDSKLMILSDTVKSLTENEEELPLSILDDVMGVENRPRLISLHHHRDDAECEDWFLSVAAGVRPSSVLAPYPALRDGHNVSFMSEPVTADSPFMITMSDQVLEMFSEENFPFEQMNLTFLGPSEQESFAMRAEQIAFHLADIYRRGGSGQDAEADTTRWLNGELAKHVDLQVAVHGLVVNANG